MINEAIFALQEDVGTPEAIDSVMKLGMNHPMGPLTLADLIGLDVVLFVMEVLQRDLGEDKYRPAYLLRKMVDAGYLGRKSRARVSTIISDQFSISREFFVIEWERHLTAHSHSTVYAGRTQEETGICASLFLLHLHLNGLILL